jgi:hypothetical protein
VILFQQKRSIAATCFAPVYRGAVYLPLQGAQVEGVQFWNDATIFALRLIRALKNNAHAIL